MGDRIKGRSDTVNGDWIGACDEDFQGDALRIEECYDLEQLVGVGTVSVEILKLRSKCSSHRFVLIVG
jgi:hypothetical protein